MLQAYVDESYTDDWFFMAAAIARSPAQVAHLDRGFKDLLRSEAARLAIPTPTEVHGYELFQGGDMWGDVKLHERMSIGHKVLGVARDADVRFIIRGIDRKAQRARYPSAYDPYPMILTHLMREIHSFATRLNTTARIICDEIHQHDRHRAMLERHRLHGTPGYKKTTLGSVVGELDFTSSVESPMVQAADIVAYLRHRAASHPDPSRPERRARASLWRVIESQVEHNYCYVP